MLRVKASVVVHGETQLFISAPPAQLYVMVARYYLHGVRDPKKAQNLYSRALSLASQCHSLKVQMGVLVGLVTIECGQGNWTEGLRLACKTHKIAVAAGTVREELNSVYCQAQCYLALGDFKHSMQLVKQGKALVAQAGLQGGSIGTILTSIEGSVYHAKTEYTEARQIYELILRQSSGHAPAHYAYALLNIVSLDLDTDKTTNITQNLHAATAAFQKAQFPRGIALCKVHSTDLKLREGDTIGACAEYKEAFTGAYAVDSNLTCYCLEKLANSSDPVHAGPEVAKWAVIFLAFVMRPAARSMRVIHQALQSFGEVLARQGVDNEALSILTVALQGFTWMDVHRNRAECMRTLGEVHFRRGQLSEAHTFWKDAKPLFERSLQAKSVAEIDSRLAEVERHDATNLKQVFNTLTVPTAPLQHPSIDAEVPMHQDEKPNAKRIDAQTVQI